MSAKSVSNYSLVLAVLANDLNLNQNRYEQILKCYPTLTNAVQDRLNLFIETCLTNKFRTQNTKISSEISFNIAQSKLTPNSTLFEQNILSINPSNRELGLIEIDNDSLKSNNSISKGWLDKIKSYDWDSLSGKVEILEQKLTQNHIEILNYSDFPDNLKALKDCPCLLYFQGDLECFKLRKTLAIIGARQITSYATKILESILPNLCQLKLGIVSGLALGVDSLAHKLSLNTNSKCIAFIGSGLDDSIFYPSQNIFLKSQILYDGGLICSEYPPGFVSMPYTFPRRNRFVASLANITWVIQASKKSGALITAKLALDFGKIVATTPSTIFDIAFEGNLSLIKDGAQIISQIEDILGLLDLSSVLISTNTTLAQNVNWSNYSKQAKTIYDKLEFEPQELQDIFLATEIPIPNLNTELSLLELAGLVENLGQGLWVRS